MIKNTSLKKAKIVKNDEFYTQLIDIEKELKYYEEQFKDKIVYSNCDSPNSNFVKFFLENKERLSIKEFYHTWYNSDTQEGSFNSEESIELLKKADIVVTNPPFSLFRAFISLMTEYDKKFLVIGNMNAIPYKNCFRLIKENRMWLGVNHPVIFEIPSHYPLLGCMFDSDGKRFAKLGNVVWFTNLPHNKLNDKLILTKEYNPIDYPKYDNYDAIECSKVKDIPKDYYKVMGVPISFLTKFNGEQFEILGCSPTYGEIPEHIENTPLHCLLNNKRLYIRLFIQQK